jgi:hypothetical protein
LKPGTRQLYRKLNGILSRSQYCRGNSGAAVYYKNIREPMW